MRSKFYAPNTTYALSYNSDYMNYLQQEKGWTIKKIANYFEASERTIYRRIKSDKQKVGRKLKLDGEALETFLAYADREHKHTRQELADYASHLTGQKITRFIIGRTLKNHQFTHKKLSPHFAEQNKAKIEEFQERLYPLLDLPIMALDESSFPLNMTPRYGYSRKGTRANFYKTGKRGLSYTLILCIANVKKYGVVLYQIVKGGVDASVFHHFLSHEKISSEDKSYLILDNASIHHADWACKKLGLTSIRELLASKNIEPFYLPPYTPEMNPVECCFNFIKGQVRRQQPKTYEELELAIESALKPLHEKDLTD
ncbi:17008_t:CDS:1 [Funneliformis geosporum]|uniref:7710_t:CDS:1 n=1 Tax=Funneliformis geosporum TaxID=1117311 RepID=A0A9W4WIY2_9GLOM|nr:17008_t:CDS:1 [Funneliformis geosporum]CAI2165144.1 7710_t:CDS:1 [Funneliformis geosporum]